MTGFYQDKMLRPIKNGIDKVEKKIAEKCLAYGIKKNPDYFNAKVAEVATKVSTRVVRDKMAELRLMKCAVESCLKRSPLRYFSGDLVCDRHFAILSASKQGAIKNG